MIKSICLILAGLSLGATDILAQQQLYGNIGEALQTGYFTLRGKAGPQNVNWIRDGAEYSFMAGTEIHTLDPATLREDTVFTGKGLTFPGTDKPFAYESFQWSHDSRHVVFRTNLRRIYRNSGISDYYLYDVGSRQLRLAAKDARSAELSPDGSRVGIERGGNMYVYDFATGSEQQ